MIDLDKELLELFNKERMIAFFDFQVLQSNTDSYSGLCKISQPKSGSQQSQYVSLLFLIDAPDDTAWQQVDTYASRLDWNAFQRELAEVVTVLPIPHLHKSTGIYFKEVDIYLNNRVSIAKRYVMNQLYPAISKIMGLKGGEMFFWDDIPEGKKELQGFTTEKELPRSIVERIKNFFGR